MDPSLLPSGRITLVFTDIEESSRSIREIGGERYREEMLRPNDERIKAAMREHEGVEVRTFGDSYLIAFKRADRALACVLAIQQGLSKQPITYVDRTGTVWTVRIRIGVHTAEEELEPYEYGNYVGDDVNFAARVQSLGRGGQVLVSESTFRAVGGEGRFEWKEWPGRRLKSFDEPETVWELLWDGQSRGEPGSRWLPSWYRRELNQFVGRSSVLAEIRDWLVQKSHPLLILFGGSGIGKTRLAIETVLRVCGQFEAGVAFVALDREATAERARLAPAHVAATIARAVDAPTEVVEDAAHQLVRHLNEAASGKQRLVVLDGWENVHNPQTLRWLADAVQDTRDVRWLITSGVVVDLVNVGQSKEILPLDIPRNDEQPLESLDSYNLFAVRVRQHREDHPLVDPAAIRSILQQTDGYPIGIELAAARVEDYSLHEIARKMQESLLEALRTPDESQNPGPGRHLSVESNLDWSVSLLPAEQRTMFPRLVAMPDTFSSAEAEARCGIRDEWLRQWRRFGLVERSELGRITLFRLRRVVREWCRRHQSVEDSGEKPGAAGRAIDTAGASLAALVTLWQERDRGAWSQYPEVYPRLAGQLLSLGEPLVAGEVVTEGLDHWPADVRLRQLRGLALARTGLVDAARSVLEQLVSEGYADAETLGILARTHKDKGIAAAEAGDETARDEHFRRALALSREAYEGFASSWAGINAATVAMLLGQRDLAHQLAGAVRAACLPALEGEQEPDGDPYWSMATVGEAALILGDGAEAEYWYGRAADAGRGRFGDLASTRKNARLLLGLGIPGIDRDRIEELLRIPKVVAFVGHMIDRPDRQPPRFPAHTERTIARAIRKRLQAMDVAFGYSSAACGSDILFQEALHELREKLGGETHVVLPYDREQFARDSVEIVPGSRWRERFNRVLDRAEVVAYPANRLEFGGISYEFANQILQGLATLRAQQLETELTYLAVWDGRSGDGPGGTADIVRRWREQGHHVEVIELPGLSPLEVHSPGTAGPDDEAPRPAVHHSGPSGSGMRIMAVLIAKIAGFDQLEESQYPPFVEDFLGLVARLLTEAGCDPMKRNAWGDGLFFAFECAREAGGFALDLCERVAAVDWANKGLPSNLALSIGLHAGPVYCCEDPVTGQWNSIGTHVSRALRIEAGASHGHAYASQEFAALAAAEGVEEFRCNYAGRAPLPGDRGTAPIYHLARDRRGGQPQAAPPAQ